MCYQPMFQLNIVHVLDHLQRPQATDGDICRRVIQRLEEIIDQSGKLPDGVQRKIMLTGMRSLLVPSRHHCNGPPCCCLDLAWRSGAEVACRTQGTA